MLARSPFACLSLARPPTAKLGPQSEPCGRPTLTGSGLQARAPTGQSICFVRAPEVSRDAMASARAEPSRVEGRPGRSSPADKYFPSCAGPNSWPPLAEPERWPKGHCEAKSTACKLGIYSFRPLFASRPSERASWTKQYLRARDKLALSHLRRANNSLSLCGPPKVGLICLFNWASLARAHEAPPFNSVPLLLLLLWRKPISPVRVGKQVSDSVCLHSSAKSSRPDASTLKLSTTGRQTNRLSRSRATN